MSLLSTQDLRWAVVFVALFAGGLKSERSPEIPRSIALQPWSYGDLVLIFLLWAGISRLDVIPVVAGLPTLSRTAVLLVCPAFVVLGAVWFLLRAKYGVSLGALGFGSAHCRYYAAWAFMVVGAILSVVGTAMTLFVLIAQPGTSLVGLPGPPAIDSPLYGYLHQSRGDLALSLVVVAYAAALGPLFEEIMFRGLFLAPFVRRFGVPIASTMSAALWSLGHSWSPAKLLATFGFGLAFANIYIRTGSLVPSTILHIFGNVFGVFLPVLLGLTEWQTLLLPGTLLGLVLFSLSRILVRRLVPTHIGVRLAWSGQRNRIPSEGVDV